MNIVVFRLTCYWSLLPRVQLTILQNWFRWRLGDKQATRRYLNQWWLILCIPRPRWVNTLRPGQNGRHFANDIFKRIFWNKNYCISIEISLNPIIQFPIINIPPLVKIMAWRRQATSHFLNQSWPSWLTHICVTRPQWFKCRRKQC